MAITEEHVMILMNRVRQGLDQPDLDYVNSETDVLAAVLTYGFRFKYVTNHQWMNSPIPSQIGGKNDGTILVVTDGRLPMEWMRARALCFAVLRKLGLTLSEQANK